MSSLLGSCSLSLVTIIITLCVGLITYFKWSYTYWEKKKLPFLKPISWYGNMENPLHRTKPMGIKIKENYDEVKQRGLKHAGIYNFASPVYFPVHPDYIKNIMQVDFQYFVNRGIYYNEKIDPLSAHLFALGGQKWRNLRVKLTPTFTSGKMKMMFDIVVQCSVPLKNEMDRITAADQPVDIREFAASYTTDVIGSCAFGLDCNSFKSPNSEFRRFGREIFQRRVWEQIMLLICFPKPLFGLWTNFRALPKASTDFFFNVVQDTVNYRKKNKVKRNDALQLLIDMKSQDSSDEPDAPALTIEEIAAQCLAFFVAGFETSSSTMTYCLFELAKNQEIQQKVRDEINDVLSRNDGKITYDSISEFKYMTQVIEETLRKYPPLPQITRKCVKNYRIPDSDVIIEKGTSVFISIYGLHYDPEYFPNPECFDPERFSEENKKNRHQFAYIPFGEGPRLCIAMRFGLMQTKVGLAVLLKNYIFSLNKKTPTTLTYNPKKFLLDTNETIFLDAKPTI